MAVDGRRVAVPAHVGEALRAYAEQEGLAVSDVVSQAIEREIRHIALGVALDHLDRSHGPASLKEKTQAEALFADAGRVVAKRRPSGESQRRNRRRCCPSRRRGSGRCTDRRPRRRRSRADVRTIPRTERRTRFVVRCGPLRGWKPPTGAVSAWSFYPTKSLGAVGDASALTRNDAALAEEMRSLAGRDDQLRDRRQITSRTDEIQAVVLRVKLRHPDSWLDERATIAKRYDARLERPGITLGTPPLHHLYFIRRRLSR